MLRDSGIQLSLSIAVLPELYLYIFSVTSFEINGRVMFQLLILIYIALTLCIEDMKTCLVSDRHVHT